MIRRKALTPCLVWSPIITHQHDLSCSRTRKEARTESHVFDGLWPRTCRLYIRCILRPELVTRFHYASIILEPFSSLNIVSPYR